ncbi:hypothetical protein O7632_26310 [Solwaraspora sp. WMMD406]|uniref:hypothetical protein n=1 Tax=Solwaraspora sp. WMMD406 TaxID=3016095 RepID=UPI00241738F2|nr:hypothetical protein [Solwaraspora sp. WMMD406]MDG4767578.1 hypothetical protein [Solwaraspora sp. WMMD406]
MRRNLAAVVRGLVIAAGLVALATGLVGAAEPYQQTRAFHRVVECEQQRSGNCFDSEPGSIVGRRIYTTTSTHTDAEGHTWTTTHTHYEITWQRADGRRQARDVTSAFYRAVGEGTAATLRLWRDEVVGIEAAGLSHWFVPESGHRLSGWLHLAWLGTGVLLWGLFGWWDGLFMLGFRVLAWMFMSIMPVWGAISVLAYGWSSGAEVVVQVVFGVLFTGVSAAMLIASLFFADW